MGKKVSRNWQGAVIAIGAAVLLMQGLQATARQDPGSAVDGFARHDIVRHGTVPVEPAHSGSGALVPPMQGQRVAEPSAISSASNAALAEKSSMASGAAGSVQFPGRQAAATSSFVRTGSLADGSGTVASGKVNGTSQSELDAAPDVASAERISLRVQGVPELSGEYRINDDQTISVPVIGRVSVDGLQSADLERQLAQRIAMLIGREAYVTIEIAEYRPVFVTGYVSRPGTAPWKPGLTILQALTLAGGDFRSGGGAGESVTLRTQKAVEDQKRVLAQIARLQAERAGARTIAIPERLVARVGRVAAESLIASQQTLFESRRTAAEAQIAGIERAIALTRVEMDQLKEQRQRLDGQLQFNREHLDRLRGLFDRGLLRADRLYDQQMKVAEVEERAASIAVSSSRAQGTLVGLERELLDVKQKRMATIDEELLKLERDAAQFDLELRSLGVAPNRPAFDGELGGGTGLSFEIVRQDRNRIRSIPADRYSLVRPGDLIVVSIKQ